MNETWNAFQTALASGDPLLFAGLALLAGLVAYVVVRRLMRVDWLKLVMRIGYFLAVAGLVAGAALSFSYYRIEAWVPLSGSVLLGFVRSPLSWSAAAAVLAAGIALRKPVPERPQMRHGVRISAPATPQPVETTETDEEHGSEDGTKADNVIRGPWRKAA